jgi:hypothetical protein
MAKRFATRLALRKLVRQGKLNKNNVKAILRDDDMLGTLIEAVEADAAEDALYAGEDGPIIAFLKYLLDNPEKLQKLIEIIMSLFSSDEA